MSLSNRQIKLINSLHSKKGRKENLLFLVEGEKCIEELLKSNWAYEILVLNENLRSSFENLSNVFFLSEDQIKKYSALQSNSFGFAVVHINENPESNIHLKGINIYLDGIRDPGNLGTIVRICDWYGINTIYVSEDTTDFYNPKTIISTMGSFTRVNVISTALHTIIENNPEIQVLGTFLEGESIYQIKFPQDMLIVLGNESNGIRQETENLIRQKITIPRIGGAESLNVGISTAIVIDNIVRSKS